MTPTQSKMLNTNAKHVPSGTISKDPGSAASPDLPSQRLPRFSNRKPPPIPSLYSSSSIPTPSLPSRTRLFLSRSRCPPRPSFYTFYRHGNSVSGGMGARMRRRRWCSGIRDRGGGCRGCEDFWQCRGRGGRWSSRGGRL